MKILGYILGCFLLAGCADTVDHTQSESAETAPPAATPSAGAAPAPATLYDVVNPLTPAEVETVKKRLDYFQPYMTQDECWKILGLPKRQYPTSVSGERPAFTITMTLREGSILAIVFDRRGYVVFAKLGDKIWEWKPKSPNNGAGANGHCPLSFVTSYEIGLSLFHC